MAVPSPGRATLQIPRRSIRQSILSSFQSSPAPILEAPVPPAKSIKVVPYINFRQVLGVTVIILWPIILGTAFNIYGFEEASAYFDLRLDVQAYQIRVEKVQDIIDTLTAGQAQILAGLKNKDGNANEIIDNYIKTATKKLEDLNAEYPELAEHHKRVTPETAIKKLKAWAVRFQNTTVKTADPTKMMDRLSKVIKDVRMFFSAFHETKLRGGDTWNNVLQQLFISEVMFRLREAASFGDFAYSTTGGTGIMNENLRLTLLRRYQRSLMALDLYNKYSLPRFQVDQLQKTCTTCNWTFLRTQKTSFWRTILSYMVSLDNAVSQSAVFAAAPGLPSTYNFSTVYATLLNDSMYPITVAQADCVEVVGEKFAQELNIGTIIFACSLAILIGWLILTSNLLGLVARSLSGIFSESYRFQWVQLCRRRAIEREKSRSDKIVAEMFFEMNFKYLYEGNLPPTVLYKEASIAFVELLQYEELCKIYTTVDHVAILDWYYHLVSASVKGFNTNVVATAGHYCLLAATHAYHTENAALSMLRLMTLVRDSFLPPPHNTKLPLIRAGIHTGPVAGAIVSLKFPLFTMLGDTVNTAARMNSKSKPYCVLLTETSNNILAPNFTTQNAGVFNVKGKGQMNTYWLLSCKWRTFEDNFINLNSAEQLRKQHGLEAELAQTASMHHRRTGFGRSHAHSLFEPGSGRRRISSFNDGSIAALGGDLLQNFLKSRKRRKSKRSGRMSTRPNIKLSTAASREPLQDDIIALANENVDFFGERAINTAKRLSKTVRTDKGKLSARIEVKASPNESYYVQVSNNINMRSWNLHRE